MHTDNAGALVTASPENVGMSTAALRRLDDALAAEVKAGRIPGAVLAVARRGRLVHLEPYGYRDAGRRVPMTADSLFWVASMTKPITVAGALTLVDQGTVALDDPIAAHLPALAGLEVATPDGGRVAPARPPTIRDLMTHTAGMVEGLTGDTPVHALYAEAFSDGMTDLTSGEFIDRLSRLPLFNQPGTTWHYGFGIDVLGLLIERVTGERLRDTLAARVFAPLGMSDTTFGLPPTEVERFARPFLIAPETGLPQALPDLGRACFDSGGAGAVSSAADYLRFASMLLGGGALGEVRVLTPARVAEMTSDQLAHGIDTSRVEDDEPTLLGYGFGLGVAVRRAMVPGALAGSLGDYTWAGAGGTYWWGDPREELAVVLMTAAPNIATRRRHRELVRRLMMEAITG
jgi:CubicO group peptidase (beta-lactamase class C family)